MSETICTFATSSSEPDLDFPTLPALARHLVTVRAKLPLGTDGLRVDLVAVSATVARSHLPSGSAVSIRARDGALGGKGSLLGYAFLPNPVRPSPAAPSLLMTAIVDEQARADARAADRAEAA